MPVIRSGYAPKLLGSSIHAARIGTVLSALTRLASVRHSSHPGISTIPCGIIIGPFNINKISDTFIVCSGVRLHAA